MLVPAGPRRPARRRRRGLRLVATALLAAGLAAAAVLVTRQLVASRPPAADAALALALALERGRLTGVPFANTSARGADAAWRAIRAGMRGASPAVSVVRVVGRGERARASLRWDWKLPLGRRWSYGARVSLRYAGGRWRPVWSPALVSPRLRPGDRLALSIREHARAGILDEAGRPIVEPRPVVDVGIEPDRVRNLTRLVRRLHAVLGIDAAALAARVRAAASPKAFVPVITLRRDRYEQVRSTIHPLPGTVFATGTLPLAPTRAFARSLLGTTGYATAELIARSHGRLTASDLVGLSGLQAAFDGRLRGRPGLVVQAVPAGNGPWRTLYAYAGLPASPVRTTLEVPAQEAADAALAGVKRPSALVAIRISTGGIVASAVGPDPGGYDIALQGEYPPGSTFKVVTTLALLERGEQPGDVVPCPARLVVDGRRLRNAEHEVLGAITFAQDFAHSCNTAFASLAPKVGGDALPAAARALGIGRPLRLGVPTFAGSVPPPADPVELASEAFGQGRILVSPLVMASMAAAVARGRWLEPRLVVEPASAPPAVGPPLPAGVVATLRGLMRLVVTEGTGTALAGQPGPSVYGKTGTAEIGTQTPPRTDAWFVGWQGDIAFAALVANTRNGFGGALAAPIVSRFLAALGGG